MKPRTLLELEERSLRLSAAGAVGASVAHELRNALAVAESALFLAQRHIDDRTKVVRHLDQVASEIRKAQAVIGSVLGLARGEPVQSEVALVGQLVEAARHTLIVPERIQFEVSIDPSDLAVRCNFILLERVLSNLYLNAMESIGEQGGTVRTVATRSKGATLIQVIDSGPGFSEDHALRAFEPLLTTKEKGTGLGLALCRVIVQAHGGSIQVQSTPNVETVFTIALP